MMKYGYIQIFGIIASSILAIGCRQSRENIDSIPVITGANLIEKKIIDGVPVSEFKISSDPDLLVLQKYNSILSDKWSKLSDDAIDFKTCIDGKTTNQICGGSISWDILNSNAQVLVTMHGAPNSAEYWLTFHEFVKGGKM